MPRQFLLCLAIAVAGLFWISFTSVARAEAAESVWSAMVFASNAGGAKSIPPELANFKVQLHDIFGYRDYEIVDSHSEPMDDPAERWVLPSKHFSLSVSAKPAGKSLYDVKLSLFHEKKLLVRTEARLGSSSPLLIRGPLCGNGQLIFVLLIKRRVPTVGAPPGNHLSATPAAGIRPVAAETAGTASR